MDQANEVVKQDQAPELKIVTLEEIEQRENAANQVACCIFNIAS